MKKIRFILVLLVCFTLISFSAEAQCSICSKTVMQMGAGPAKGFNTGILYLMFVPYAAVAFIGYRWYKSRQGNE